MMRRLSVLALAALAGAAAQENKTAAEGFGQGSKREAAGKRTATTAGQLAVETAKLDAQIQALDARRKELEADSAGKSEDGKERVAKAIRELDAQRAPIEASRSRMDQ